MKEDSCHLTKEEAQYCIQIVSLAAKACTGADFGLKTTALYHRLNAELEKPAGLMVSLTEEEKKLLSASLMVVELLTREKYDVLEEHFHVKDIPSGAEESRKEAEQLGQLARALDIDTSALQKKLRDHKKVPARKLYIADLHFYHNNINTIMDRRGFPGYEEMNAYMVRQWNEHVTKKDEIYILGDFSISRGRAANEVLRQLNGRKYLVEGNHDRFLEDKEFDRSLFEWIRPYAEIRDASRKVVLSHYPVFCYNGQYRTTAEGAPTTYMLYGHVHNTHDEKLVNEFIRITRETKVISARQAQERPLPCCMINCFCMFSDYIPLTLDDWIVLDARRREQMSC